MAAKKFSDLPPIVQTAILVVIPVAIAAALFFFGIPTVMDPVMALSDKVAALDKQVKDLEADNAKNKIFEQQRTEYLNRIAQLETQLATLRSIVPDEQATDDFIRMVRDDSDVTVAFVRTFISMPFVTRDFYIEMPFNIKVDGTYFALVNFFSRLAHEQRIVSVSGLSLNPAAAGGGYTLRPGETVTAGCILTTYFNRPQAAAAPAKMK